MEFLSQLSNLSFPAGIYQDLLTDKIRPGSQQNQTSSFIFARTIDLGAAAGQVIIPIVFKVWEDYHFHVDTIRVHYPKLLNGNDAPELRLRIEQVELGRQITPEPDALLVRLISTPGQEQILRTAQKINLTCSAASLIKFELSNFATEAGTELNFTAAGLRIPKINYSYV